MSEPCQHVWTEDNYSFKCRCCGTGGDKFTIFREQLSLAQERIAALEAFARNFLIQPVYKDPAYFSVPELCFMTKAKHDALEVEAASLLGLEIALEGEKR